MHYTIFNYTQKTHISAKVSLITNCPKNVLIPFQVVQTYPVRMISSIFFVHKTEKQHYSALKINMIP